MTPKMFAVVRRGAETKTRHYVGLPPELTGGQDLRTPMPTACVVAIVEELGDVFLYRFASDGAPAGDTWHPNFGEARYQADFEFGAALGAWMAVPDNVKTILDMAAFVQAGDWERER